MSKLILWVLILGGLFGGGYELCHLLQRSKAEALAAKVRADSIEAHQRDSLRAIEAARLRDSVALAFSRAAQLEVSANHWRAIANGHLEEDDSLRKKLEAVTTDAERVPILQQEVVTLRLSAYGFRHEADTLRAANRDLARAAFYSDSLRQVAEATAADHEASYTSSLRRVYQENDSLRAKLEPKRFAGIRLPTCVIGPGATVPVAWPLTVAKGASVTCGYTIHLH